MTEVKSSMTPPMMFSGCAKFASDVGDAEDEDEEHQPRHGVRAHAGARGGEKTDEGPEKAGDDRAVEHGDVFIGADSNPCT